MDTTELLKLQRENRQLADHINLLNGTISRLEAELKVANARRWRAEVDFMWTRKRNDELETRQ
jgi:hypothetical protein